MLCVILLLGALHAAAQAVPMSDEDLHKLPLPPTDAPTCCGTEAVRLMLSQLIQEQREVTSGQAEVIKVLRTMRDQGEQQLTDLHNLARQLSLQVENNQALLQQVSRIANMLQELSKSLVSTSQKEEASEDRA